MKFRLSHCLLLLCLPFAACGDSENDPKKVDGAEGVKVADPQPEVASTEELLRKLEAGELSAAELGGIGKERTQILLAHILDLDLGRRHDLAKAFFESLAKSDPALASQLLPQDMSRREQQDWGVPIAAGFVRSGDVKAATDFLNSISSGGVRAQAIIACIELLGEETSADKALEFWESLDLNDTSERAAGPFAAFLAQRDPKRAVEWFESLELRGTKHLVVDSVVAKGRADIVKQMESAVDPALRRALGRRFGWALFSEESSVESALPALQKLPEDLVSQARVSYARSIGAGLQLKGLDQTVAIKELSELPQELQGDAEAGYVDAFTIESTTGTAVDEALEAYVSEGLTINGRDRAATIMAERYLEQDPKKGVALLLSSGVSERYPERWMAFIESWVATDPSAAASVVGSMDDGASRDAAAKIVLSHLTARGDPKAVEEFQSKVGSQ